MLTLREQERASIRRWSAVEQWIRVASGVAIVAVFIGLVLGAVWAVVASSGVVR